MQKERVEEKALLAEQEPHKFRHEQPCDLKEEEEGACIPYSMASQRLVETGLSETGPSTTHHHMTYSVFHGISNPTTAFINQVGPTFDFGELEEAIVLRGVRIDEAKATTLYSGNNDDDKGGGTAATLDMFPSWPIRFQQTPRVISKSNDSNTDSGSGINNNNIYTSQVEAESSESPVSIKAPLDYHHHLQNQSLEEMTAAAAAAREGSFPPLNQPQQLVKPLQEKAQRKGRGVGVSSTSDKPLDAKTLRRLAQNREAARKSRLRKKAYVQQLESSRIKLTQIEQDLHRARSQGLFVAGCGGNLSSVAAIFDAEYARWLEDDHRHMSELRTGLQAHLSDGDLRVIVDGYISHYDEIFVMKCEAAQSDVFHLITGMWATPAERCFLWMAGFRPSELIKMLTPQLDPLTEQQLMGIYSLQQSSQQAEEALSQGLDQLQQSLVETIASGSALDGMQQMGIALGKLANLQGFVRQADNLRQQTLHQLRRILTVRQAARCFLVIGEYYGRLRALSSLWQSRPRDQDAIMPDGSPGQIPTDLQMVQPIQQNHFPKF
ncbi:hypothetical protein MLD38_008232 [Melastoma candidum]|uniref:Uncharacterized protein n=1 Tax=Melastoma candidum TaxID=119954 RepID=A0ACB9RTL1_9MYRT|nr:hypothetical protein MLD38_008232 [Melastoma candidum]